MKLKENAKFNRILPAIGYIWNNIHNKDKRVHYAIYVLSPNR